MNQMSELLDIYQYIKANFLVMTEKDKFSIRNYIIII